MIWHIHNGYLVTVPALGREVTGERGQLGRVLSTFTSPAIHHHSLIRPTLLHGNHIQPSPLLPLTITGQSVPVVLSVIDSEIGWDRLLKNKAKVYQYMTSKALKPL